MEPVAGTAVQVTIKTSFRPSSSPSGIKPVHFCTHLYSNHSFATETHNFQMLANAERLCKLRNIEYDEYRCCGAQRAFIPTPSLENGDLDRGAIAGHER
jgi:hypothetical protein